MRAYQQEKLYLIASAMPSVKGRAWGENPPLPPRAAASTGRGIWLNTRTPFPRSLESNTLARALFQESCISNGYGIVTRLWVVSFSNERETALRAGGTTRQNTRA